MPAAYGLCTEGLKDSNQHLAGLDSRFLIRFGQSSHDLVNGKKNDPGNPCQIPSHCFGRKPAQVTNHDAINSTDQTWNPGPGAKKHKPSFCSKLHNVQFLPCIPPELVTLLDL